MHRRLKALPAKIAQGGLVLTDARSLALEKAKANKETMVNSRVNITGTVEPKILYS